MTNITAKRTTAGMDVPGVSGFRDVHRGATLVVCGCGASLAACKPPDHVITIGVNDVSRLFTPDYLVVVNPRNQFAGDRFRHVEQSGAEALFTQLDLGPVRPPVVRFRLGRYGGTGCDDPDVLHYTQNSPYVAVCLAAHMGAARIGLIGVDFTDDHFFGRTGRHPLTGRLERIDKEYGALAQALLARGVELVNLSPVSRLQSLPRADLDGFVGHAAATSGPSARNRRGERAAPADAAEIIAGARATRLFVVNHRYIACGDVFKDGLRHAAEELGVQHADAYCDDPRLAQKVAAFHPDLLLVVHGRRFARTWKGRLRVAHSAAWITEDPYEVDDTCAWSTIFDTVFVNDPATLDRHRNAHYLPVCFDPLVHRPDDGPRRHRLGFIGAYSALRERCLVQLAQAGLLSYVVGGPWRSPLLRALTLAANVPAARCAQLYRQTEVVVNVFRETHHYNARGTPALSMNPRIYEALACGAVVVSQRRAEIADIFPEIPQFDTAEELVAIVKALLDDAGHQAALRERCMARLAGHTYRDRLSRALTLALAQPADAGAKPAPPTIDPGVTMPRSQSHTLLSATALRPAVTPPAPVPASAGRQSALPFPAATRRNLLFHVWPVQGNTWRWNLDQLKRRIDLFNGRRIIGIVCDERSEPAEAVQAYMEGHGCEFVVNANDPRGEVLTFPRMMESVASTDDSELSFYAHAKGVKYEPEVPQTVRRWAEVQYGVLLDDWLAVKAQMQRYAMTGALRKVGRFRVHDRLSDWHYCGTYFWMRHARVFRRPWQVVPQIYGGVETWPGTLFPREETGCMLLDNLQEFPYFERFWTSRGNPAFRRWQASVRRAPAPATLATPEALDGHASPRLEQKPAEFDWWIGQLLHHEVRSLLFIGSGWGGEEWHVARRFHLAGRRIAITSLSVTDRAGHAAAVEDARARFGQSISLVHGEASQPDIAARLAPHYDAVFIDGRHGYRDCRLDVDFALDLGPRLIGLHDIVDSDWHAQNLCCVSRVWAELRKSYRTEEMASGEWAGIGLVHCGL
jgi:hypothetical protein